MKVPPELVPRCPVCGKPMAMNLRADDTFVQDQGWYEAAERYQNFLEERQGKRLLLLELPPGGMKILFSAIRTAPSFTWNWGWV